ncbi:MAG: fused MFS/spermidine synthase [Gammaproteobacteria bacterium]
MNGIPKPLHAFERTGLYLSVFLTGGAVMVIELLGTRIIAPFYGVSLYVWSSLISVALIALAIGYFAGGRWADRAKRTGLSLVISLAGLFTLLIPWMTRPVLLACDSLGLRAGAFVSALVLFSPSLMLLGMVGPFAIKLATSRLEGVGTSAGSIYAVSTFGSVVGTLLLGFFLFPVVGSREILIGLGVALLALAVAVAIYEQKRLGRTAAVLPCVLSAAIGIASLPRAVGAGRSYTGGDTLEIRSERESLYGWVRVIDQKKADLRLLMSDASTIGAASISTGENRLTYQDIVHLIPALVPGMKRALLIGQGAGHMATTLRDRYGIVTDTLEIDPAVAAAASDYFGFAPTGEAIVGDARYEIRRLKGPYDLIIHDCFTGGSEPVHLLTVETLSQLRGLLSDRGILALNFVAFLQGGRNATLTSVSRTIAEVFPHHSVFIAEPGRDFNDFIFLAGNQAIDLGSQILDASQRAWLRERSIILDETQGVILTDDFNPLERLQTRKAEHYRRILVDWFGTELLVR